MFDHVIIVPSLDLVYVTIQVTMELVKVAVLVLVCLGVSHGLYFHIGETEQRCFIEEVPAETMIVGKLGGRPCAVQCLPPSKYIIKCSILFCMASFFL